MALPISIVYLISDADNEANLVVDPNFAAKVFTRHGIDRSKAVVVYGESDDPSAVRIIWSHVTMAILI